MSCQTSTNNTKILKRAGNFEYDDDIPSLFRNLGTFAIAQQSAPFDFQGAPYMNNPPVKQDRYTYLFRKKDDEIFNSDSNNTKKFNEDLAAYTKAEKYKLVYLRQDNVLEGNKNSTLRYQNKKYIFQFGCIHEPINMTKCQTLQFSLVFENEETRDIFHICLPLNLNTDSANENIFMKYWIYQNAYKTEKKPSGFSLNSIFQFENPSAAMYITNYCAITFGSKDDAKFQYSFCYIFNGITLNKNNVIDSLKTWLNSNRQINSTSTLFNGTNIAENSVWRPIYFEEVWNIYYQRKRDIWYDEKQKKRFDPYRYNNIRFFASWNNQPNSTQINIGEYPANPYLVSKESLSKSLFRQGKSTLAAPTDLKNLKCFPIDIYRDVDDDGNIMVDSNKKPVPIAKPDDLRMNEKMDQGNERRNVLIGFIIALLVILGIIIAIVFLFLLFYRYKSATAVKGAVEVATAATMSLSARSPAAQAALSNTLNQLAKADELLQQAMIK